MTVSEALTARDTAPAAMPQAVLDVAAAAAGQVDAEGRFPHEAFAALREHGMLSAFIPKSLGGHGTSLRRAAADCQMLGAACGSAGMVLAMHHIQVACLVRHSADEPWVAEFLRRAHRDQLLMASSTSEAKVGGSLRTSDTSFIVEGDRFSVTKEASAISYGTQADAILITARANPDAPMGDQAFAVLERGDFELEPKSVWDAMGMRGTESGAFILTGKARRDQIVRTPFADIAGATMVPVSHALWGAVWTGIATDAVMRARAFLRARRKPGDAEPSAGALELGEAVELLQMAEARVSRAIDAFDWDNPTGPSFAGAAADNGLKTSLSEACLQVVQRTMAVCGFAGYARQGPFSVSRHLRDLHSAPLMIANSRMRDSAARLLLAQKPLLGLA